MLKNDEPLNVDGEFFNTTKSIVLVYRQSDKYISLVCSHMQSGNFKFEWQYQRKIFNLILPTLPVV